MVREIRADQVMREGKWGRAGQAIETWGRKTRAMFREARRRSLCIRTFPRITRIKLPGRLLKIYMSHSVVWLSLWAIRSGQNRSSAPIRLPENVRKDKDKQTS